MPLGSPIRIFGEHPYFPYPGYLHISSSLRSSVLSSQFFSDMASLGAAAYCFPSLYTRFTQVVGGYRRLSAVSPHPTEVTYFLLFVEQVLAKVSGLDWKNVRRLSEVQQGKKKTLDEM